MSLQVSIGNDKLKDENIILISFYFMDTSFFFSERKRLPEPLPTPPRRRSVTREALVELQREREAALERCVAELEDEEEQFALARRRLMERRQERERRRNDVAEVRRRIERLEASKY